MLLLLKKYTSFDLLNNLFFLYERLDLFLVELSHIICGLNKTVKTKKMYLKLSYILCFFSYEYNILLENKAKCHMWNCYDSNWDNEIRTNRPYQFLFQLFYYECFSFDSELKWYWRRSNYSNHISYFLFTRFLVRMVLTAFPIFIYW